MHEQKIRVRAIILTQGRVLLIHRIKKDDDYFVFPGGGVDSPESKEEAVVRECKEELGIDVRPGRVFMIQKSGKKETFGQEEFFYFVTISGGVLGNVTGPEFQHDTEYVGKYIHEWHDVKEIPDLDLRPSSVRDALFEYVKKHGKEQH